MSDAAKRERDAGYARDYRARKRQVEAERVRAASDGKPGPMRQAVESSISAAKWLSGTDAASIAQARALAAIVDSATEDVRLQMRAHGLLSRVLGEMGLTARVRMQLELRARKLDAEIAEGPRPSGNVTPIASKRPPKRSTRRDGA